MILESPDFRSRKKCEVVEKRDALKQMQNDKERESTTERIRKWRTEKEETAFQERSTWISGKKSGCNQSIPSCCTIWHVMQGNFTVKSMGLQLSCQGSKPSSPLINSMTLLNLFQKSHLKEEQKLPEGFLQRLKPRLQAGFVTNT